MGYALRNNKNHRKAQAFEDEAMIHLSLDMVRHWQALEAGHKQRARVVKEGDYPKKLIALIKDCLRTYSK